jgi:RND superfamily putative drug exporter
VVLVATAPDGVDSPAAMAAGAELTAALAAFDGIETADSYWTLGQAPPLRSDGGDRALVLGRLGW